MDFTHALCGVEISARFTAEEWSTTVTPASPQTTGVDIGGIININYIALHGLYTSGTYDMATGVWSTNDATKNQAYYRYAFSPALQIAAQSVTSAEEKIKRYVLVPDSKFLLIPQTIIPWNPAANDGESTLQGIGAGEADELGVAYIEINCSFTNVQGMTGTDSYYLPLQFSVNTLAPGKKYKLLLNLNNLLYEAGNDGEGVLEQVFGDVIINT